MRDGIREIDAGDLDGGTAHESVVAYVSTFLAWVDGDVERRMPGGQSGTESLARFDEVVAEAEPLGHDVVAFVNNGAIIQAWVGTRTDDVDVEFFRTNFVANTGYAIIDGSTADGWHLGAWQGGGLFESPLVAADDDFPAAKILDD